MFTYTTTGALVDTVNDVEAAQKYLAADDMAQYLDDGLALIVTSVRWELADDGRHYTVTAEAERALTTAELTALADWVSGQNSDGLGEGFEQQDFAWNGDDEEGNMCSFDWRINDSTFHKIV